MISGQNQLHKDLIIIYKSRSCLNWKTFSNVQHAVKSITSTPYENQCIYTKFFYNSRRIGISHLHTNFILLYVTSYHVRKVNVRRKEKCRISFFFLIQVCFLSYPNFVRGLLLDDIQPLIGRFEILGTLCCTICEVPRRAGNQKEAGLCDP